jgi:hypothetical protein
MAISPLSGIFSAGGAGLYIVAGAAVITIQLVSSRLPN